MVEINETRQIPARVNFLRFVFNHAIVVQTNEEDPDKSFTCKKRIRCLSKRLKTSKSLVDEDIDHLSTRVLKS